MADNKNAMPMGMGMMLKALGVDPSMFTQVAGAVQDIAKRLKSIEEKQDKILELLGEKNAETRGKAA